MIQKYFLLLVLCLMSIKLTAQEKLSIQDVISLMLENNYDIQLTKNSEQIAENNYSFGNAGFLPTLDLGGNLARNNNLRFEATNQNDSTFVLRNVRSSNYGVDATLNWVLFDGTKMFITLNKLQSIREQANWEAKVVIENSISEALVAYYAIINEKSRLSILRDALSLSQERKEIAEEKYKLGNFSRSEFLAAQVDYNTDQSAVLAQEGILNEAKVNLNVLLARSAERSFDVQDSLIKVDNYFEIEKLRTELKADNYQLASSKVGLQIAAKEKQEIKTELLPQLSFQANTGLGGSNNPVGFLRSTNTTSLNYGLTASWRIFDGFNRNRRVQNAIVNEQNQEVSLNSLQNQLLGQLQTQ